MRTLQDEIRFARLKAGMSARETARLVCRSGQWLREVETGVTPISLEDGRKILRAIERYVAARAKHEEAIARIRRESQLLRRTSATPMEVAS